jgi:hypothetical protein
MSRYAVGRLAPAATNTQSGSWVLLAATTLCALTFYVLSKIFGRLYFGFHPPGRVAHWSDRFGSRPFALVKALGVSSRDRGSRALRIQTTAGLLRDQGYAATRRVSPV